MILNIIIKSIDREYPLLLLSYENIFIFSNDNYGVFKLIILYVEDHKIELNTGRDSYRMFSILNVIYFIINTILILIPLNYYLTLQGNIILF